MKSIAAKIRRISGLCPFSIEVRSLIREINRASPLWGAPRIHGELLKLDIEVGQAPVATSRRDQAAAKTDADSVS